VDSNKALDLLLEIKDETSKSSERLAAIETDLKYHIKRTDLLEEFVNELKRDVYIARGAIALILASGAIAAFFKLFG